MAGPDIRGRNRSRLGSCGVEAGRGERGARSSDPQSRDDDLVTSSPGMWCRVRFSWSERKGRAQELALRQSRWRLTSTENPATSGRPSQYCSARAAWMLANDARLISDRSTVPQGRGSGRYPHGPRRRGRLGRAASLCRAIARDPTEGVAPEGGARPTIVGDCENKFVIIRDAATLLFSATTTLRVYLVMATVKKGSRP